MVFIWAFLILNFKEPSQAWHFDEFNLILTRIWHAFVWRGEKRFAAFPVNHRLETTVTVDWTDWIRFSYCWTSNRPAWSKIEGRLAHVKKVLKFINQKSSKFSWVVSQTRVLQRSNNQENISQSIYRYVSTCVIFSLAARTVQRSSNQHSPPFVPLGPAKQVTYS